MFYGYRSGRGEKGPYGSPFSNAAKTRGIIALRLDKGDNLNRAILRRETEEIMLITKHGYALRFHEENVRAMGRATRGVHGIRLLSSDELAGCGVRGRKQERYS